MPKRTSKKTETKSDTKKPQAKPSTMRIFMYTNYRNLAKEGEVWETDISKAKELIALGRAREAKKGE